MKTAIAELRALVPLVLLSGLWAPPCNGQTYDSIAANAEGPITVNAEVALSALLALGDGHLTKMADSLAILASSEAATTGDWERIRGPLAQLAETNAPALNWFALPDGSYWSVQEGKAEGNLSRRDYWPKVLAGDTILGDLVISTATGKPVAIVAVPVFDPTQRMVGVLGASIYLDQLSARIQAQLGLDETMIFYSFDDDARVALNWDPQLIFFEPRKTEDAQLVAAFEEMLTKEEGVVVYRFRDHDRTVLYRTSPVTGWRYAFGIVPEGRGTP
jgi:hypothetical protein